MPIIYLDSDFLEQEARKPGTTLHDAILKAQRQTNVLVQSGKVFQPLITDVDIKPVYTDTVTTGLWTGNTGSLAAYVTSSVFSDNQKQYFYEILNSAYGSSNSEPQFAVSYGNINGSGSYSQGQLNDSPTRAIYSQYQSILLNPDDTTFSFYGNINPNHVYAISINRNRLRERLDAGNWQLSLAELNGTAYANAAYTGSNVQVSSSNKVITLIDDSNLTNSQTATPAGRVYNIVSGSIANGIYGASTSTSHSYGLVYPDLGILIFNADKLNSILSFNTVTASFTTTGSNAIPGGDNARKLFTSISGAAAMNSNNRFQGRSEESVKSQVIFVRALNSDFNFSNNPTFSSNTTGVLAQTVMINNPKVYITAVGLYNKDYELVAVAKLSKPLLKSFNHETTIRVKIDY